MSISPMLFIVSLLYGFECHEKTDLVFILETSGVVSHQQINLTFGFIPRLLEFYSIAPSNTRVTFISFEDKEKLQFLFHSHTNRRSLLSALSALKKRITLKGSTLGLPRAIDLALKIFHRHRRKHVRADIILFIYSLTNMKITKNQQRRLVNKIHSSGVRVRSIVFNHVNPRFSLLKTKTLKTSKDVDRILNHWFKGKGKYTDCKGSGVVNDECHRQCVCTAGKLRSCARIRKEFTTFSAVERKRYLTAFKLLSSSKYYKRRYEALTKVHQVNFWKGVHRKDQLLPWHRWYLLQLENLLREIDCRITIPFWDWSYWSHVAWSPTKHIWAVDYLGGNGNPMKDFCVENGIFSRQKWQTPSYEDSYTIYDQTQSQASLVRSHHQSKSIHPRPRCLRRYFHGRPPSFTAVHEALKLPLQKFSRFEVITRNFFHSNIHCSIGGTMCTAFASSAPEFWLHHAMLDYIWYRWQKKSVKHRDVYFTEQQRYLLSYMRQTRELVDSLNLPGHISVKYRIFKKFWEQPPGLKREHIWKSKRDAEDSAAAKWRSLFPVLSEEATIVEKFQAIVNKKEKNLYKSLA